MSGQYTPDEPFGALEKEFLGYASDLVDDDGNHVERSDLPTLRDAFMAGAFVVFKAGIIIVDDEADGGLEAQLEVRRAFMDKIKHELTAYARRARAGEVP